jgi:serine/threonine protein kinase
MGIASSIIKNSQKTNLNDFVHQREIGRGGFSSVTCVVNKKSKNYYALKKTSIVGAINRCGNVNFLSTEIQCLKAIGTRHPFIVGLHYAFHDFADCYLVLDLVPGGDLRYQLDRKFLMNEIDLALIALCLGSALKHIHERNIIHRDIKPENIVIDRHGIPHLTDFGISFCGKTPEPGELLICNLPSGTKPYMAPEMFARSRLHGTAADYWGLGITLFELCYGTRPFKALPPSYIQYARRCHYYEWHAVCADPIVDTDYEEGLVVNLMTGGLGGDSHTNIKTSSLFQDFMSQLLNVQIQSRLGGSESKQKLLNHPWIASHSTHWFGKISALESTKHSASSQQSKSFLSKSSSSKEDREMVMTSDWYSERYLSCRKIGSFSSLTKCSDGTVGEVITDIRRTIHFNKEMEEMLSLYDYEAPSSGEHDGIEDILQLGRSDQERDSLTRYEDTAGTNGAGGSTLSLMRRIRSQLSEEAPEKFIVQGADE